MKPALPLRANRRQVLAGGALALATAAMTRTAAATEPSELLQLATGSTVVLHDRHVPLTAEAARQLTANGAQIIVLTDDPVRMWRGELGGLLSGRDTRLVGVTRWPEFLLVSGLAAESRRRVRYQRLDDATGAIVWLIA